MDTKVYITTKEQCQSLIDKYKCVCNQCGGNLQPIETVDNADRPTFWAGCMECMIYTHGVDNETFKVARYLVTEKQHYAYKHITEPPKENNDEYEVFVRRQTAGACWIVRDVLNYYKELQEANKVPINVQALELRK